MSEGAASSLLNWGYTPIGTPLGSESALSMPTDEASGLGDPMAQTAGMLQNFVAQTQRRYGDVSEASGALWDPRGNGALSDEVADYRKSDLLRPDEVAVQLNASDDQLGGGDPIRAPFLPDSTAAADALYDAPLGLSRAGAASLADSLVTYDPKITNSIHLPPQVEPRISNSIGFTTTHGGLPDAFFDSRAGVLHQGIPEAVDRVIAASGEYQYVDENGVVHKYAPGNGPYDAVQAGRISMGTLTSARQRTAADRRANPSGSPAGIPGSKSPIPSRRPQPGSSKLSVASNVLPNPGAGSSPAGDALPTGSSTVTGGDPVITDSVGVAGGAEQGVTEGGSYYPDEPSTKKWLIGGIAAVGIGALAFFLTRKKGKKGKK